MWHMFSTQYLKPFSILEKKIQKKSFFAPLNPPFLKKLKILTFFENPLWGHVAHVDYGNIFFRSVLECMYVTSSHPGPEGPRLLLARRAKTRKRGAERPVFLVHNNRLPSVHHCQ